MTAMTAATTDLERRIRAMPKFEIHVHMEGGSDADTYWALAERNGIDLPHDDLESFRRWFDFVDFDHFIDVYVTAVNLLTSPGDFRFLVEAFHEHQARQNIVYSEAFLSATYIAGRFDHDAVIDALAEGLERGRARHGVEVRLIPDIARHEPDSQRPVLDFVKRRSHSRRSSRTPGIMGCTSLPTRARARDRRACGARWRRSGPSGSAMGCAASRIWS